MEYSVLITTIDGKDKAETLASEILKNNLAACIQISPVTSFFVWDKEVQNEPEYKLLIKTRSALYDKLEKFIKEIHSYDVPEIIELPINNGLKDYLDWIDEETS